MGREGVNAKALLDVRFHSNFLQRCWESFVVVSAAITGSGYPLFKKHPFPESNGRLDS